MKAIAYLVALLVAGAGWLGAQDTAHPPAPPTPPPPPPAPAVAPAPPAAPAASLTVAEAAVAKTVVDRAPQDTGTAFTPDVGQLICWTKVTGASGDATIHHVWFHGDTQVGDVELHVGGSPWRTWSRKTIPADGTGAWHVEIRDAAGTVLKRIEFRVGG